jgi:hypothetical protein
MLRYEWSASPEYASPDVPLALDSESMLVLGGRETPEESFHQVHSSIVGSDGDGNLYVLDRDAYRIYIFDSVGRHQRTLGGQGGGPGELQFPIALTVAEDGRVWVADIGRRSLVHWDPDGQPVPAEEFPAGYSGGEIRWTSAGMVFPLQDRGQGQRLVVVSASGEPAVLATIAATEMRAVQLQSCGMSFSGLGPIFSPSFTWAASGTTVAVARNPDYVIDLYENGRHMGSVRRDLSPRPATAALAEASLGDGMRVVTEAGERVCDPAEVVDQRGFAPYLPMLARLAISPDGTLWVQRYSVGEDPKPIDIFDSQGRYLGTLPEDAPFPVGFLPDGRVLFSEKDEWDVERLAVKTVEVGRHR